MAEPGYKLISKGHVLSLSRCPFPRKEVQAYGDAVLFQETRHLNMETGSLQVLWPPSILSNKMDVQGMRSTTYTLILLLTCTITMIYCRLRKPFNSTTITRVRRVAGRYQGTDVKSHSISHYTAHLATDEVLSFSFECDEQWHLRNYPCIISTIICSDSFSVIWCHKLNN